LKPDFDLDSIMFTLYVVYI